MIVLRSSGAQRVESLGPAGLACFPCSKGVARRFGDIPSGRFSFGVWQFGNSGNAETCGGTASRVGSRHGRGEGFPRNAPWRDFT